MHGWAVVAVTAVVGTGACGGSVTSTHGDGGGALDAATGADSPALSDAPSADSPASGFDAQGDSSGLTYDGTTGKTCASDADCKVAGGPGVARCSSTVFAPEAYFATAVCILPTCSPVSDTTAHYCDGPDVPSSPGICMPYGTTGGGICLPKCTFDKTGDPATGCQGKDVCFADTSASQGGVGYCWGGCTQDGDCPTGQKCQTDQGVCVEGVVPPTKTFGQACTKADYDDGVCYCLYGAASTGYCSSFCIVGGPPTCPAGTICDGLEYRQDGFTTSTPGLGGFCTVPCTAGADTGATCPASTTCTDIFAAGPDCIP
jgi:hypothetical protein